MGSERNAKYLLLHVYVLENFLDENQELGVCFDYQ
jgi:hypothetical protein